jgi:hypothetical protein
LVEEIGWRMPRIEVAGDISLRRSRPTQGCRAVMMMMMMMVVVCINRHYQHQNGGKNTVRITQRHPTKQTRE